MRRTATIRLLLPGLLASLLAGLVVLSMPACDRAIAEPEGAKHVTVATPDGEQLDAVELGSGSDVAILSHGATGTKEGFYPLVEALAQAGWRVIDYDARGVGSSTGGPEDDRITDLGAVVAYARDSGADSIVLVGASLGASLSIQMAADLKADALVSLSAPASSFDALEAASGLRGSIPMMVVAADGNEPYATDAVALSDAAGVEPVIVEGDGHGTGMFGDDPGLIDAIVGFVDQARSSS